MNETISIGFAITGSFCTFAKTLTLLSELVKEEQENDQKTEQNNKEAEGKGKKKELTRTQEIEKSIRKKFHKQIFSKFVKAIKTYDLVQENDKIAICISGGKDSMLMAKLFQELKRHNKLILYF